MSIREKITAKTEAIEKAFTQYSSDTAATALKLLTAIPRFAQRPGVGETSAGLYILADNFETELMLRQSGNNPDIDLTHYQQSGQCFGLAFSSDGTIQLSNTRSNGDGIEVRTATISPGREHVPIMTQTDPKTDPIASSQTFCLRCLCHEFGIHEVFLTNPKS